MAHRMEKLGCIPRGACSPSDVPLADQLDTSSAHSIQQRLSGRARTTSMRGPYELSFAAKRRRQATDITLVSKYDGGGKLFPRIGPLISCPLMESA